MAIPSIPRLAVLTLGLALAAAASAADEAQLVEAINAYRGQVQSCGGQASGELPPLAADPRLALPVNAAGDLQQAMAQAAYPMVNVQSISLSGPRDAGAAMKRCRKASAAWCSTRNSSTSASAGTATGASSSPGHCCAAAWAIGERKGRSSWNGSTPPAGKPASAVASPTQRPSRWPGTPPLAAPPKRIRGRWPTATSTTSTATAAPRRPRRAGRLQRRADRRNIAAGQDGVDKVVDGWLASPGHCANLMNPGYRELGAAYATDPKSDAGIYWTAMFGSP